MLHLLRRSAFVLALATCQSASAEENPAAPWNLEKLFAPPAVEWVKGGGPVRALFYTGEPFQGRPTRVFAYYASPETVTGTAPKAPEKHPGVVLIHGGGGTAFKQWAELWAKRGYAAIAMDLSGMRPDEVDNKKRTRLPDGGPDQGHPAKFETIATEDVTDDWCYHAVANSILAHSLLLSLPEVDAQRTAVTGISWGGYTTCIVASLDHRFKAAVPVYGCGFLQDNSAWLTEFTRLGPEKTARWVRLYDPSSHLPKCRVPVFFVNGTNDFAYPLDSYMKSFAAVTQAPKNIRLQVKMPHGHEVGWAPVEIGLFTDHLLGVRGEKALPMCEAPKVQENQVTAKTTSAVSVKAATFSYALPGEAINKREWITVPASQENGILSAPSPPTGADMWFFSVTDERGATVSSTVTIKR